MGYAMPTKIRIDSQDTSGKHERPSRKQTNKERQIQSPPPSWGNQNDCYQGIGRFKYSCHHLKVLQLAESFLLIVLQLRSSRFITNDLASNPIMSKCNHEHPASGVRILELISELPSDLETTTRYKLPTTFGLCKHERVKRRRIWSVMKEDTGYQMHLPHHFRYRELNRRVSRALVPLTNLRHKIGSRGYKTSALEDSNRREVKRKLAKAKEGGWRSTVLLTSR